MHGPRFGRRPDEAAFFQAFGKQAHAIPTPPQHLDAVAPATSEDKYMAAEGILVQRILHNRCQPIKAPAHVRHAGSQPHAGYRGVGRSFERLSEKAQYLGIDVFQVKLAFRQHHPQSTQPL